ncbi:DNA-binding transcriptional regulator YbjK [Lipingzhangella halophila]|uniref:DNA-binding transcriptional regulator YbjK n=1 Tax=Lipingzhangella halophila TaxID=1783352 RepID=A0A7W7RNH1_9ACTN|nr:TetR family transcriptional regulator [Lipingzhangella halophila]MBB4935270.1 DNA-binding transcriptional regulator YbjK [Lipingzhangella halophila]
MRQNTARRTALLDAAIDALADQGTRKLTFRAVDARAGVPIGTASNYFANRDALLAQAAAHVHVRLAPSEDELAGMQAAAPTREVVREAMHKLFARVSQDRAGYLALLELRLEATRRPELRQVLMDTAGQNIHENIRFHVAGGYPGGRQAVASLYLAMSGLITEHLTLPEAWEWTTFPELIDQLVERILPE